MINPNAYFDGETSIFEVPYGDNYPPGCSTGDSYFTESEISAPKKPKSNSPMELTYHPKRQRYEFTCERSEDYKAKQALFAFDKKLLVRYTTRACVAIRLLSYCQDDALRAEIEERAHDEPDPERPFLDFDGKVFRYWARFENNNLAKDAGFRFSDNPEPHWWTSDFDAAVRCHNNCAQFPGFYQQSDTCKEALEIWVEHQDEALAASRAVDAFIEIPGMKKKPHPFQFAGIKFAYESLTASKGCFIADVPRLGKTLQAIYASWLTQSFPIVCVVPQVAKYVWRDELLACLPIERDDIAILSGRTANSLTGLKARFFIINYDVLLNWVNKLLALNPGVIIFDESQMLRNGKTVKNSDNSRTFTTKRVQAAADLAFSTKKKIMTTGTAIMNSPADLLPQLQILERIDEFGGPFKFMLRYQNGHKANGFWDFSGASHLDELNLKLRGGGIMIRRTKEDVFGELPPKQRQIIEFEAEGCDQLVAEQTAWARQETLRERLTLAVEMSKASEDTEDYRQAVAALRDGSRASFAEVARARIETAIAKVPYVIQHVRGLLETDPDVKIILFCWHHEVMDLYEIQFEDECVVLHGKTPEKQKERNIYAFQNDPKKRLFIGQIQAAGAVIKLSAASIVVFAEFTHVPSDLTQAEERPWTMEKKDPILIQHLVLAGSYDAQMIVTTVAKQEIIDKALDGDPGVPALAEVVEEPDRMTVPIPGGPEIEHPSTHSLSREKIATEALTITEDEIRLVHSQLKRLAAMCDGAYAQDGSGFNKVDSGIGKQLATREHLTPRQGVLGRQIIKKYHRQLEKLW